MHVQHFLRAKQKFSSLEGCRQCGQFEKYGILFVNLENDGFASWYTQPIVSRAVHTSLFPPRAPLPTPRARDPAPTVVQVKRQTHVPTGRRHFGYARLIAVRIRLVERGQQPRVESVEGGLEQRQADVPCGDRLDEALKGERKRVRMWSVSPLARRDGTDDAVEVRTGHEGGEQRMCVRVFPAKGRCRRRLRLEHGASIA